MLYWYQVTIDWIFQTLHNYKPESFDEAEWKDATQTMAIDCFALMLLWPLAKHFYVRRSQRFAALPRKRQWYVIANLSKAACLAIMCLHPSFFDSLRHMFWQQSLLQKNNCATVVAEPAAAASAAAASAVAEVGSGIQAIWLKRCSALYLASDAVALLLVPDLPTTTIFHHWTSVLLGLCFFGTRLEQANVTLMIALYAGWSALAFPVNLFLALRFSCEKSWWLPHLAWLSLVIYVVVCALNWTWHAAWLCNQLFVADVLSDWYGLCVLAYSGCVIVLARDDLVLMSWLWSKARKTKIKKE